MLRKWQGRQGWPAGRKVVRGLKAGSLVLHRSMRMMPVPFGGRMEETNGRMSGWCWKHLDPCGPLQPGSRRRKPLAGSQM